MLAANKSSFLVLHTFAWAWYDRNVAIARALLPQVNARGSWGLRTAT